MSKITKTTIAQAFEACHNVEELNRAERLLLRKIEIQDDDTSSELARYTKAVCKKLKNEAVDNFERLMESIRNA